MIYVTLALGSGGTAFKCPHHCNEIAQPPGSIRDIFTDLYHYVLASSGYSTELMQAVCCIQDYQTGVRYHLGAKRTNQILYLSVVNVTHVPENPIVTQLRSREVHIVEEKTAACTPGTAGDCEVSISILSRYPLRIVSPLFFSQNLFIHLIQV